MLVVRWYYAIEGIVIKFLEWHITWRSVLLLCGHYIERNQFCNYLCSIGQYWVASLSLYPSAYDMIPYDTSLCCETTNTGNGPCMLWMVTDATHGRMTARWLATTVGMCTLCDNILAMGEDDQNCSMLYLYHNCMKSYALIWSLLTGKLWPVV